MRHTRPILTILFLFSGVSGLVYEVVWVRMFALVMGNTVFSVSTVLTVFMSGLALGSYTWGRLADKIGSKSIYCSLMGFLRPE